MKKIRNIEWIALAISIMALLLAWAAYNRAGIDLEQQIEFQLTGIRQEIKEQIALAEARIKLNAIRTRVVLRNEYYEARMDVISLRRDLKQSFELAEQESKELWMEIDADLEKLEVELRDESSEALVRIDQIIGKLHSQVEVDMQEQCEMSGGDWRQFPNACADTCSYAADNSMVCAQVLTYSCDCGTDMCWNGAACEPI